MPKKHAHLCKLEFIVGEEPIALYFDGRLLNGDEVALVQFHVWQLALDRLPPY